MNKKISSLIKETVDKYGINNYISIRAAFIEDDKYQELFNKYIEIDIKQIESLFAPDKFDFERQRLEKLEVEK